MQTTNTWMRSTLRRWVGLALVGLVLPVLAQENPNQIPGQTQAPTQAQWGQRLLQLIILPQDALAQLQSAPAGSAAQGLGAVPAGAQEGAAIWSNQTQTLTPQDSPYTVVIKVHGIAQADGDAALNLRAGWVVDGTVHKLMWPGMAQKAVHAGQAVELQGVSVPVTMKQDREARLRIEGGSASNLQLGSVQIEIWSGMGNVSMGNSWLSWFPILLGLFFVAFMVWLRRQ